MTAILSVRDLVVQFSTRHGLLTAVDGVSFDLKRGQSLGLVGESGSGKSTLAKAVVGLLRPRTGSIKLDGKEIVGLSRAQMRPHRGRIQMVFQDPDASLNPRLTVGRIIEEPLLVHKLGNGAQRRRRVDELLERVGLRSAMARQFPHEFSGGQRQRIGIARALALNPEILVADEPVSALDVSVRGQVINLLNDLQKELGLSYLFISHDLSVVTHSSEQIMVLYLGKLVETAARHEFWQLPLHPYTRALLDAAPSADPDAAPRGRALLEGEIPSPLNPPSGCRFRTRCGHAVENCGWVEPPLTALSSGREIACHLVQEGPEGHIKRAGGQPGAPAP